MFSVFSSNLAARLGARTFHLTNATESLLVVFEQRDLLATGMTPQFVRALDDAGRESGAASCVGLSRPASNRWICRATLENFPRRQPSFRLRAYAQSREGPKQLAEFELRTPASLPRVEWKPEPLPLTVRDGLEELTLVAFNTGLYATGVLTPASRDWTELVFQQDTNRADSGPWTVRQVEVSDATGNIWSVPGGGSERCHR